MKGESGGTLLVSSHHGVQVTKVTKNHDFDVTGPERKDDGAEEAGHQSVRGTRIGMLERQVKNSINKVTKRKFALNNIPLK